MSQSKRLLARASKVIPGGVNSPVRAFRAVGGDPPFIARGEGNELVDVDGHHYLDLVCSWGALIVGHANTAVLGAAMAAASRGSTFGAPTEGEILLAEEIVSRVPSVEKVRLVSSGTEATMHALRLARGATGRELVVKLEGCYHGAHDGMLVKAGSGGRDLLGRPGHHPRGLSRRPVGHGRRDPGGPVQRSRADGGAVRRRRRQDRGRDRRARRREHGHRAAAARLPRGPPRAVYEARRAADLRRGDDRVPRRAGAARRSASASGRI